MKKMLLFLTGMMFLSIASNASLYAMKRPEMPKKGINKKGLICLGLVAFASMVSGVPIDPMMATKEDCKDICNFESPYAQVLKGNDQKKTAMEDFTCPFPIHGDGAALSIAVLVSLRNQVDNNHENYFPLATDAALQCSKCADAFLQDIACDIYSSLFEQEYAPAFDAAASSAAYWMASTAPNDQLRAISLYEKLFEQDYPQHVVTDATAAVIRGIESNNAEYQSYALRLLALLVSNKQALDIARPIAIKSMASSDKNVVAGALDVFTALVEISDLASFADAKIATNDAKECTETFEIAYAKEKLIDALCKKRLLRKGCIFTPYCGGK